MDVSLHEKEDCGFKKSQNLPFRAWTLSILKLTGIKFVAII